MAFRFLRKPARIRRSEAVVFFPTWAAFDPVLGVWNAHLHGWLSKPAAGAARRAALLSIFRRYMKIKRRAAEWKLVRQRARPFVAGLHRGRRVDVCIADRWHTLEPRGRMGHVVGLSSLDPLEVAGLLGEALGNNAWVTYRAEAPHWPDGVAQGAVQLVPEEGISIVSDIDDTVKVTDMSSRRAVLQNTFLRPYEAVPGMPQTYRRWFESGAVFHYVSSSPWQLYQPLAEFFEEVGYPRGSFHLKTFRFRFLRRKKPALEQQLSDIEPVKREAIVPLLEAFPRRQFVLVGDSGQYDPEVYAGLYRDYPDRVAQIFIRNITGDAADGARFAAAFRDVPRERWQLFTSASELPDLSIESPVSA